MASARRVSVAVVLVATAMSLAGCVAQGTGAATDTAREQFAEMNDQFISNAPPGNDDFVRYVYEHKLDEHGELAIDQFGEPDRTYLGMGGRSSRQIFGARAAGGQGIVDVLVMGYSSAAGWGARPATVYSCMTATFDLERGGRPEYADADCIQELRGAIATHTHKTVRELGG
jgi:hypothetical protein